MWSSHTFLNTCLLIFCNTQDCSAFIHSFSLPNNQPIYKPNNQPIYKPTNQLTGQSANQSNSKNKPVNRPTSQTTNQSANPFGNEPPVIQSTNHSLSQPINLPVACTSGVQLPYSPNHLPSWHCSSQDLPLSGHVTVVMRSSRLTSSPGSTVRSGQPTTETDNDEFPA